MTTIYKTFTKVAVEGKVRVNWHSSEANAKRDRTLMAEEFKLARNDTDYDVVELQTSKAGVLEWLNANYRAEFPSA